MKNFSILICVLITGCASYNEDSEIKFREKVIEITEEYAKTQLGATDMNHSDDGVILLSGNGYEYLIETQKIITGQINEDQEEDALVTLIPVNQIMENAKLLIILGKKDNPYLFKTVESDMKILQLENRVITAEVPEYPRSSPLFNCHECREIVKYRLVSGDLKKIE